ncbi:hypothetical protein DPMN_124206 [Dreissena polymorpha]|uniref:Uncharacterized protein n=1 Tax=Dreissena polymorpha TaxID=45954 RepID=A0A9D4GT22_DREPO|nr:hypothetical protein DPMN_124206 [Dreissena polymorpha]
MRQQCAPRTSSQPSLSVLERTSGTSEYRSESLAAPSGHEKCKHYQHIQSQGDRSVCNNNRGISLPNVVGKVLTCVVVNRLHKDAN